MFTSTSTDADVVRTWSQTFRTISFNQSVLRKTDDVFRSTCGVRITNKPENVDMMSISAWQHIMAMRAHEGHSKKVNINDLGYTIVGQAAAASSSGGESPADEICHHGTSRGNWESIVANGLKPGFKGRNELFFKLRPYVPHVNTPEDHVKWRPIQIEVSKRAMLRNNISLRKTQSECIVTRDSVTPDCFLRVLQVNTGAILWERKTHEVNERRSAEENRG